MAIFLRVRRVSVTGTASGFSLLWRASACYPKAMHKRLNLYMDKELLARIERVRRQLMAAAPGIEITLGGTVRHLLLEALDAKEGKPRR
jgi:hypothetical protein